MWECYMFQALRAIEIINRFWARIRVFKVSISPYPAKIRTCKAPEINCPFSFVMYFNPDKKIVLELY